MKKKGFTLVELLAVIVILAVILIIAMPKISDVIKNSKEASLETTAKLIAGQAEKKYTENQVLDGSSTIKCSDVAKISDADYESCNITFDSKGNAKVTIVGKGKFEGMAVYDGTKDSAKASTKKDIVETAAKYFSYKYTTAVTNFIVEDTNKCESYLVAWNSNLTQEQATTLCNGGAVDGTTLDDGVKGGYIPASDYDKAGITLTDNQNTTITITGYNPDGGLDVVIPSQIDGKTVVAIADNAFTAGGVIPTGTAYNNDYKVSLLSYNSNNNYVVKPLSSSIEGLGITSVVIPNTVTSIGQSAFRNNQLTSIVIPNSVTSIGGSAFENNQLANVVIPNSVTIIGDYAFYGNQLTSIVIPNSVTSIGGSAFENNQLANVVIPNSVTIIGDYAFYGNQLTSITFPTTPITLACGAFEGNPIMEDGSYSFPSNVTEVCE